MKWTACSAVRLFLHEKKHEKGHCASNTAKLHDLLHPGFKNTTYKVCEYDILKFSSLNFLLAIGLMFFLICHPVFLITGYEFSCFVEGTESSGNLREL